VNRTARHLINRAAPVDRGEGTALLNALFGDVADRWALIDLLNFAGSETAVTTNHQLSLKSHNEPRLGLAAGMPMYLTLTTLAIGASFGQVNE
jgi:hypothetical protein